MLSMKMQKQYCGLCLPTGWILDKKSQCCHLMILFLISGETVTASYTKLFRHFQKLQSCLRARKNDQLFDLE
jgi:copper(I)-binding protein